MARRLLLLAFVLPLVLVGPAAGDPDDRKEAVDAQIASLEAKMAVAEQREDALAAEIASVSSDIRALERQVGDVTRRLDALEEDLALHRQRLAQLTELLDLQTRRLAFLRRQHRESVQRLNRRLIALYQRDDPDALDVIVSAASFSDMLDGLDFVRDIGDQDAHISAQVKAARDQMRALRAKTKRTQSRVAAATRVIAIRTTQQLALHSQLVSRKEGLTAAHRSREQTLASVEEAHHGYAAEARALEAVSSQLTAQIQAAQSATTQSVSPSASVSTDAPSSSGFVWPVSGTVVSSFGWRWGRMHEGIDIAAGHGAPIFAAASGTIISAGWLGGYGNLIVIDHGGGLATAYAHLSGFAVSGGSVSQGQTIGYVGCTGHCFGPHLHFEVRVNGAAVDPLGYL